MLAVIPLLRGVNGGRDHQAVENVACLCGGVFSSGSSGFRVLGLACAFGGLRANRDFATNRGPLPEALHYALRLLA